MHLKKTLLPGVVAMLLLVSCKKDNDAVSPGEEDCVTGNSVDNSNIIEGKYIVAFQPGNTAGKGISIEQLAEVSVSTLERHQIRASAIEANFAGEPGGFIARLSKEEVAELQTDVAIRSIEPDRIVSLSTCFTIAEPRLITWNIHRVGFGDGRGKRAWIIDSGIDFDHPDLTVDKVRSKSFLSGQTSADDENGHGTHVAGIIGGNNNTIGVLGVASGATLISLRVLDKDGNGTVSSIIQALGYINTNAVAGDVVNLSLGEEVSSPTLIAQVQNTAAKGIFIAIAAGNDSQPAKNVSPGNANGLNIYTVSAVDSTDKFASFSNYGNDVVDYAAPGVRILSTFSNGRYAYLSGTSMAAPHMAGLLLLRGRNITISGTAKNDPDGTPDPIAHY